MAAPTKTIGQLLYYFGDVRTTSIWKRNARTPRLFTGSNHPAVAFTARSRAGKLYPLEDIRAFRRLLAALDIMAKDPRFSRLSILDLQNILTAIELCDLGFGSGKQVCEGLNKSCAMSGLTVHLAEELPKFLFHNSLPLRCTKEAL